MSIHHTGRALAATEQINDRATTIAEVKAIVEAALNKRNLPTNVPLANLGITQTDMDSINTKLKERYHHHMEAYLVDSIEEITRILTGNF